MFFVFFCGFSECFPGFSGDFLWSFSVFAMFFLLVMGFL